MATCHAAAVTRDGAAVIAVWTPELDDYLEAVRARNKAHHANRKMTVIVGLCLLAVVAGWVAGADWLMGFGISGAVFGGAFLLFAPPLAVRRLWRTRAILRANMRMVLHPDNGMSLQAGGIVSTYPWSTLGRVLETPRVFVVHLAGRGRSPSMLLAKRALAGPDEEAAARQLLQNAGAGAAD